jgi:hydrogenase nickel incorporation protein HypB
MAQAQQEASVLRRHMAQRGTLVVNVLSSPGSGKTSLLAATARHWHNDFRMAALVGDIATDRDAVRLAPYMPVVQLTTGGACHLELPLIEQGVAALGQPELDFLFIENVGNLVCPSSHDLGEHRRVVLLSAPEGDDKPGKYPKAFRTAHALVISKTDLLPHVPFSIEKVVGDARLIQPDLSIVVVSSQTNDGISEWCQLLHTWREQLTVE